MIYFGGPDRPVGELRNRLQALVDEATAGSRIDWATYYFRDLDLAQALIRASDRGVQVTVVVEPTPRHAGANDAVMALLSQHGLQGGFFTRPRLGRWSRLHSKVYAFADEALIGSFNPSGSDQGADEIYAAIGDQDRGFNLLCSITQPRLLHALRRYVSRLASGSAGAGRRMNREQNQPVVAEGAALYFYPRLIPGVVERDLEGVGVGDRLSVAASHLKSGPLLHALTRASASGAQVEVVSHSTARRFSSAAEQALRRVGIQVWRIGDGRDLPMHNKFVVVEQADRLGRAWLGSLNFNKQSRWLNDEVLYRTVDAGDLTQLAERFALMKQFAD